MIRFMKSISRYGFAEALRLAACGWSRRPHGIGSIAWCRFGLRNLRRLVGDAGEVEIVLTMPWGGGASMYLEKRLAETPDSRVTFVVRPVLAESGRLACEVYRGSCRIKSGLLRAVEELTCLAGHDVHVVVNELVQWHHYWPEDVMNEEVLEKTVASVLALKQALSASVTYLVHDYFSVCPRWTLTRDDGVYCDSEFSCASCGDCLAADSEQFAYEGGISIVRWRQTFGRLLSVADEVRVFSEDTGRRMARIYPDLKIRCVPHEPNGPVLRRPKLSRQPIVVGVFGPSTPNKGARQVAELVDYLRATGRTDVRVASIDHYVREEMPDIVEREGVNVAFFSSVVPETFSYVTQELMMMQLPVVCFDIGAPADRVRRYEKGRVVMEMTPAAVWSAIEELMR